MEAPVVGIVGAGQLARMLQPPAVALGVPLRALAEYADSAAGQVVPDTEVGDPADLETLLAWSKPCSVVTFDHEQVPSAHLAALEAAGVTCRPGSAALLHAQDKAVMRRRLSELGLPCPRYVVVRAAEDVTRFAAEVGFPVVLKAPRGGYDGKGVWFAASADAVAKLLARLPAGVSLLCEEAVPFRRELSALVARSPSGQLAAYPVVETVQRDGVCVEVTAPAPDLDPELAATAAELAAEVATELGVTGILAVELFETSDGRLLVNELAMRPHNTGHWSIDGAVTSQFENHLRAVLDLPLGEPFARAPWTVTVNILGGPVPSLYDGFPHVFARDPGLRVHLYGKSVRPGRKVGHVSAYGDDLAALLARARHAAVWFAGDADAEQETGTPPGEGPAEGALGAPSSEPREPQS
ncbi:MAG TPA: 5-(carboxyamino)imidazole ribonucleotide synthase [Nocardioidaceae bacterium]|nr:5-(carboxyamino)imidazole ribonucleotide synthase [Nocardioidaceae bacterium]